MGCSGTFCTFIKYISRSVSGSFGTSSTLVATFRRICGGGTRGATEWQVFLKIAHWYKLAAKFFAE